jgi:hypothetical protein
MVLPELPMSAAPTLAGYSEWGATCGSDEFGLDALPFAVVTLGTSGEALYSSKGTVRHLLRRAGQVQILACNLEQKRSRWMVTSFGAQQLFVPLSHLRPIHGVQGYTLGGGQTPMQFLAGEVAPWVHRVTVTFSTLNGTQHQTRQLRLNGGYYAAIAPATAPYYLVIVKAFGGDGTHLGQVRCNLHSNIGAGGVGPNNGIGGPTNGNESEGALLC